MAERGGWFSRADARACGYPESLIRERVRDGRWRRLCRDAYVDVATEPTEEKRWERAARVHQLMAAAVLHRLADGAVLSHQSAVVVHGLPTWRLGLDQVQVTKQAGRWRSSDEVVVHRARIAPDDVVTVDGLRVVTPARAVVEAACASSYEVAVVLFDAALREGMTTAAELAAVVTQLRRRAGSPHAVNALAFADGRSESVGESRLRVLMARRGLPAPELQAEVRDRGGQLVARVDFLFPAERLVVEFDGEAKYGGDGTVVVAEKWREDRIRELGYGVVRAGWSDLDMPVRTSRRISAALTRAAA